MSRRRRRSRHLPHGCLLIVPRSLLQHASEVTQLSPHAQTVTLCCSVVAEIMMMMMMVVVVVVIVVVVVVVVVTTYSNTI